MSEIRILRPDDAPTIIEFETRRLATTEPDENERQFKAWHASWREESLKHYIPLGWSFGIFDEQQGRAQLLGYFLGQPQLFTRGLTQTLWIERIVATQASIVAELVDVAYRLSREKHLQRILITVQDDTTDLAGSVLQLRQVEDTLFELKTTKFN